jgi:histidine triad (HIT) family protein
MTTPTTGTDCIFCGIAAGSVPARIVYSDEHAVAFLDRQPWQRGHTLVVPRRHAESLLTGPSLLSAVAPAVEATARLLVDRLDADGLNLVSSSGEAAGQEVFHLHLHLVPRYREQPGLRGLFSPHHVKDDDLDSLHLQITGGR